MLRDIQYGFRQLRRNKLFSAVVILLLAIGVGSNTLIFSFVNALLLKPLPVRNPGNLFLLQKVREKQVRPDTSFTYALFEQAARRTDLFSDVIAEQAWSEENLVPMGDAGGLRLVMTQIVSPNYFSKLGISAALGRVLIASDANTSSNIPVVLSYQFWQSAFAGRRDIAGSTIRLKNHPFLIVGVLPRDFHSLDIERAPDVRMPISAALALTGKPVTDDDESRPRYGFEILVRLASHVSPGQAGAALLPEMQSKYEWLLRQSNARDPHPQTAQFLDSYIRSVNDYRLELQFAGRGISQLRDQFSRALKLLMGAVLLLLFGVCINVTGLLLSKSETRKSEISIRLSIGGSRGRILRQLLSENLVLAASAALLGLAFAYALSPLMIRLLPVARSVDQYASPRILSVTPDVSVLLFSLALSSATILVFGLAPAWQAAKLDLNAELKGSGRASAQRMPGIAPVAVQIALSVVLLAAASLMLRTFWNLNHLNPGFDRAHIVGFTLDPGDVGYSAAQAGIFFRELRERVAAVPGVRAIAYASRGLMRGAGIKTTLAPQGVVLPRTTFLNTSFNQVSPNYFETMGTPLLAGRSLRSGDRDKKPARLVVNRALADLLFPHVNAVGKFLVGGVDGTQPPMGIIVGVAATAKYRSMREQDPPTFYELLNENQGSSLIMYVRTFGDPVHVISAVRNVIRKLDSSVPIVEISTLEQEVQNSLWQERLVGILSIFFAIVALALAAIGLYGALAYSVTQRSRELGIRIAVGAQVRHILQTVCGRVTWSVAFGLVGGIIASVLLLKVTRHLLFGVDPLDPLSFVAVSGAILLFAILAAMIPSWRAVRIDPSIALREE